MTDPRVRGSRVGQLAASGSYWLPARIDLDTPLSKLDSRIIDDIRVIGGPYSVLDGPGLRFLDIELSRSPRFEQTETHGSTSFDFKTNGQQWYGRQSLWGGASDWGFRFGYGQRVGSDYVTGAGTEMPSGYQSRDMDLALGKDLSPDAHIEYTGLRLDQTNVEFPGMAFDINALVADGHEIHYILENQDCFDRLAVDVWYNDTRFNGDAQRPNKRRQFPYFNEIHYRGFTNVDMTSVGFRTAMTWGQQDSPHLTAGVDLRNVVQGLDEISSGRIPLSPTPIVFNNVNSPLPLSQQADPGLFAEAVIPLSERLSIRSGVRFDVVEATILENQANLVHLGIQRLSLAEILGTSDFDQHFQPGLIFLTGHYDLDAHWSIEAGVGHGERPPSLTELYVAGAFMFLLQNGLNTVTGDPRLLPEKLTQIDLGLACKYDSFRGGVKGFLGWAHDYITFENFGIFRDKDGNLVQVNLKYVNTDLATLNGLETFGEYDLSPHLSAFATLKYLVGTDQTRNGDFATRPASPGHPSSRDYSKPRGYFSSVSGGATEPLPGILPLESRLGLRLHQAGPKPRWAVEFSARVVDEQDLVAASLKETPTPGFTTYDIRTYWRANDHWLFVSGVENLTNKFYREHLDLHSQSGQSVYQPGVNFYFGTELSY